MAAHISIETNRTALLRLVASLIAMAGWAGVRFDLPGAGLRLPQPVRLAMLKLLRPAESATRRLAIALASQIPPLSPSKRRPPKRPPPILPEFFEIDPRNVVRPGELKSGIQLPASASRRVGPDGTLISWLIPKPAPPAPAIQRHAVPMNRTGRGQKIQSRRVRRALFPLIDPLPSPFRRRRGFSLVRSKPRIRSLASTINAPANSPDGKIEADALARRISVLTAALEDLPAQARRYQHWQRRRAAILARRAHDLAYAEQRRNTAPCGVYIGEPSFKPARLSPLKPGRPPGGRLDRWEPDRPRRKHIREIDEILAHTHNMALYALETRDTS